MKKLTIVTLTFLLLTVMFNIDTLLKVGAPLLAMAIGFAGCAILIYGGVMDADYYKEEELVEDLY